MKALTEVEYEELFVEVERGQRPLMAPLDASIVARIEAFVVLLSERGVSSR